MLGKDLSEALGGICDAKIEASAQVYTRKKNTRTLLFRVAAMAATLAILLTAALWPWKNGDGQIVSAPGILKVYAYDTTSALDIDKMVCYELQDGLASHPFKWTFAMNSLYGLPLTLQISDSFFAGKNVKFEVRVQYGNFYGDIRNDKYKDEKNDQVASLREAELGKNFVIDNGETIFWNPSELYRFTNPNLSIDKVMEEIGNVIEARVMIWAEESIIGGATIAFGYENGWYSASVLKSIYYPPQDGKVQQIAEEDIYYEMGWE